MTQITLEKWLKSAIFKAFLGCRIVGAFGADMLYHSKSQRFGRYSAETGRQIGVGLFRIFWRGLSGGYSTAL